MSDMNIYQRINAVMKEVEYVQKDATVGGGASGYKAVTHDMVSAVVRPSLVKHGIVIRLEQLQHSMPIMRDVKNDVKMHLYDADYAVHFVNMDHPDDFLTVTINSQANDNGDKAPGKAASYAVKYAMLKTFSLETGENEESRFAEPYSPEQLAVYHDLLDTDKAYEFYMFCSTLPQETLNALYNSFPDGKKSQGKKAVNKLNKEGLEAFMAMVTEVQERLAQQDVSVIEVTDEMNAMEKKLLITRLSDFEIKQLKKIKEASV